MTRFWFKITILTALFICAASPLSQASEYEKIPAEGRSIVTSSSESCCEVKGDCSNDGALDPRDRACLVNCMWRIYTPLCYPECPEDGDVNCDGTSNPLDAVYLVNHFYKFGPEPCDCSQTP